MKSTFKQFLITERVYQSTLDEISNDSKNLIGMEFEYFDHGVKETAGNYGAVTSELEQQYETFMKEVEEYFESKEEWGKRNIALIVEKKEELEEEVETLSSKLDDLDEELEKLDEKISNLQNKVETGTSTDKLEDRLEKLEETKVKKTEEREKLDEEIDSIQDDVNKLDEFDDSYYGNNEYEEFGDLVGGLDSDFDEYPPTTPSELDDWFANQGFSDEDVKGLVWEYINEESANLSLPAPDVRESEHGLEEQFDDIIESGFDTDGFPFPEPLVRETNTKRWSVVPDGSLPIGDGGIEVVSPIMVLKDGLNAMDMMFDYIKGHGHTSTEPQTGFHVNASYKGFDQNNLDIVKMIVFSDEGYVKKFFSDRDKTSMVKFMRSRLEASVNFENPLKILQGLKDNPETAKAYASLKSLQKNIIPLLLPNNEKFNAINFGNSKGKTGRIEFRYLGGAGYERDFVVIKKQIQRFYYLLKLGMEPEYMKQEYIRRIMSLANAKGDMIGVDTTKRENRLHTIGDIKDGERTIGRVELSDKGDMVFIYSYSDGYTKKMTVRQFRIYYAKNKDSIEIKNKVNIKNLVDLPAIRNNVPLELYGHLKGHKVFMGQERVEYSKEIGGKEHVLYGAIVIDGKNKSLIYLEPDDENFGWMVGEAGGQLRTVRVVKKEVDANHSFKRFRPF